MSMESDTLFRGVKRPKPDRSCSGMPMDSDTFFQRFIRPKPDPYDAMFPSPDSELAGGVPIVPLPIKTCVDASFEFHDLVKCTFWFDNRPRRHLRGKDSYHRRSPTVYYITFQAKPKGDPSSSPDLIIFQAKISIGQDKLPVVQECRIKI